MSTTIDQRVVEMRFDNKNFENNVSHTMSTLEKLKQKLNLTGASKGLQEVDSAAKKVNMSGLGASVDAVSAKFSSMQVVGTTALVNITNQAVNAGKRMISALTIDPVKTGFSEYETQINAVQTILANTSAKGTTIDDVNKALEELNKYADLTIYNFTEMTRNIGTFTAAGIDLDTSVNAIQGIANLAAVSGSTSQQASTAMYQLSQALASGTVKLMDWNSVVNAGMGGEVFQNALKATSEALGTGAEAAIKAEGSFRESLRTGWLTSEVLTETLKKFTTSGANEIVAEYTGLSKEMVAETLANAEAQYGEAEAIEHASKALAEKSGKSAEEIKSTLEMARTATDAATKVKTFTQLWDVMKEAAQSGWSQTWKLIIGDFEEAKELLTPLSDFFTGVINKMSDARNNLLEGALGKSFRDIGDRVRKITDPIKKSADSIKDVVKSVEEYAVVVDEIIGGKWGTGQSRWDRLTEAGYDWAYAQNKVNEQLGSSVRHTTKYAEATDKVADAEEASVNAQSEMTDVMAKKLARLAEMEEAELRSLEYEEDQIAALKELKRVAEQTGIPLEELLKNIDQIDGRWLLVNSFKNAGQGIVSVFQAIGTAWRETFPAMQSDQLFNIIAGLHKFSTVIESVKTRSDDITRTFKGLFALVDIVATIFAGGFKLAFNLAKAVLEHFNIDLLGLTANIGDFLVKVRDWIDRVLDMSHVVDRVIPFIQNAAKAIKDWFAGMKEIEGVEKFISMVRRLFFSIKRIDFSSDNPFQWVIQNIKSAFNALKDIDMSALGMYIIDGLVIGLGKGVINVIQTIIEVGKDLVSSFCEELGIASPSKVFIALGGFIIAGLLVGLKEGIIEVPEMLQGIVDKCIAIIQAIDWKTVFAVGISVASLMFIKKITDIMEAFSAPFAGVGDILENVADVVESFGKVTKATANNINAKALRNLTIAIAILVGSVLAIALLVDDPKDLIPAVTVVLGMSLVLIGLAMAMDKMSDASIKIDKSGFNASGLKQSLLTIALAILAVAGAVALMGKLSSDEFTQGIVGVISALAAMALFVLGLQKYGDMINVSDNISKIGGMLIKTSLALLIMVAAVKLIGNLDMSTILKGVGFITVFGILITSLSKVAKSAGNNVGAVGGMILKTAIALALMVGICKLAGKLSLKEMLKGAAVAGAFLVFSNYLIKFSQMNNKHHVDGVGSAILGISAAMVLMIGVCKLAGMLTPGELVKGTIFIGVMMAFMAGFVQVLKIGDETEMAKVGRAMLSLAVSVAILALVATLLGALPIGWLAKGLVAVGVLSAFMTMMIHAAKGVFGFHKTMIAMVVGIGLLALCVAAFCLIPDEKRLAEKAAVLGGLILAFSGMIRAAGYAKDSTMLWKTIIKLLVITTVLAGLVALLSAIPNPDGALKSAIALSTLMTAMTGMLAGISAIGKYLGGGTKTGILGLSKMIVPLVLFVAALRFMPPFEDAYDKVTALTSLMAAMTGLLAVVSTIGKYLGGGMKAGIIGLSAMVIPLMIFAAALHFMPSFDNTYEKITALSTLMLAMTGLLAAVSVIGKYLSKGMVSGIAGLSAMVIPLMIFAAALHFMPSFDNTYEKITALSTLMLAMTILLPIVSVIGKYLKGGMVSGIAGLTAMAIPLAAFAAALHFMPDLGNAREKITALTSLMVAMTVLLPVVSLVGKFVKGGMVAGIAGLSAMAIPLFLFASIIGRMNPIDSRVTTSILALTQVMITMTVLLAAVSLVGQFLAAGIIPGIVGLIGFMAVMGLFIAAVGYIIDTFPQIQTWVDKGIPLLIQLAGGIGDMIGAFMGSIGTQLSGSLVKMGEDIAEFMNQLKTASENASGIEAGSLDGALALIDALGSIALVAAGTQLADWFTFGGTSMDKFKTDAIAFFTAMEEIGPKMAECVIPEDFSVEGVISLLEALKKIGGYTVGAQFADFFTLGGTALDKFKRDAIAFFGAFEEIGDEVIKFTFPSDFNIEGLETLLKVMKKTAWAMAGVSIADVFAKIAGDEGTMEKFKKDAIAFFGAIKALCEEGVMTGFSFPKDFDMDGLDNLLTVLKRTAGAMVGVSLGDIFAKIVGDEGSMEKFQTDATGFFTAIKEISKGMVGFAFPSEFKTEDLDTMFGVLQTVAKNVRGISWKELFTFGLKDDEGNSISSIQKFQQHGTELFAAIKAIATEASGVTTAPFDTASTVVDKIKEIIENVKDLDYSGVADFTGIGVGQGGRGADGPMHDIAVAIKDFGTQISGINVEAVNTAVTAAGKIRTFISKLVGLDTSGIQTFKDAIDELGTISFDKVVAAFDTSSTALTSAGVDLINGLMSGIKSKQHDMLALVHKLLTDAITVIRSRLALFNTVGDMLMAQFAMGMKAKAPVVVAAAIVPVANAAIVLRLYYSSFYSAGSYLVDGFAAGISANSYKAAAKASAMASAAVQAAQEALGINSPSKVFYQIGSFTGQGLINALIDYGTKVYNAGSEMGDSARSGLADAIGKVKDIINGEVDMQPTIRPVLDLSNVEAGAGAINGMFGSSVGLMANVGAINSMMNNRQNGDNDDVVTAINALRKDLGNVGNTTYSINGITYDDGSNVSDAIKTLVRAAKVERRI